MEFQIISLTIIILFLGAFIRSFIGFGDALLAIPLLSLFIDLEKAVSLVAGNSILISTVLSIKLIRSIQWKPALILTAFTAFGIPIGLWILKTIPLAYMNILIGFFLISF